MMNKKIYNKKGFFSGVFFLILAVIYVILLIINPHGINSITNIKSILFAILSVLIGAGQIYRSMDNKCTKEDFHNDDERNRLVVLKTESSAYKITFNISIALTLLLAIAIGVTKNDDFIGILVGVAIMPTIMIISYICANFYHNKRN